MARIYDGYTREMYDEFGHFACWLPNIRLALGDVGTLRGRRFEKLTTLAELGVTFAEDEPSVAGDLEYATAGQVVVAVEGTLPEQSAVSITFTGGGATFFQAGGCVWTHITGLPAVEKQLLDLPEWRTDYVLVTKLLRTGPAVVLVSSEKGARVEVQLSADMLAGSVPIAQASARLAVAGTSSLAARVAVSEGATPLFRAMGLRRPFIGGPHGGRRRLRWRTSGSADSTALTTVTWDEYAEDV